MAKARVFGLFVACILKIVSVTADPAFGVNVMIRGSGAVQGTAVLIEQRFLELTEHMSFTLVSSYSKLSNLRTVMDLLARNVSSTGTTFAAALNVATTSTSDVSLTFQPIIRSLADLRTLQVVKLSAILTEVEGLVGLPLKVELQDSFETIATSVQYMAGASLQLVSAIVNANNPANIDLAFVDMVNRAASVLRANVLPINYTIASTAEHIRAADAFLGRLASSVQSSTVTVRNDVRSFLQQIGQLKNSILQALSCTKQQLTGLGPSVAPFVQTLCTGKALSQCDLQETVQQIVQLQAPAKDEVAATLIAQFKQLEPYEATFTAEAAVIFNGIYQLGVFLADMTVIKGPYSLYCFHKYANLVEQLLPRVTDGLNVCYREEIKRLGALRTGLLNMYVTFVYDFEDLFDQLQRCAKSAEPGNCVGRVDIYYKLLASFMSDKLKHMKDYVTAETNSSSLRLVLCASELTEIATDIRSLRNDIGQCRQNGPPYTMPGLEL